MLIFQETIKNSVNNSLEGPDKHKIAMIHSSPSIHMRIFDNRQNQFRGIYSDNITQVDDYISIK